MYIYEGDPLDADQHRKLINYNQIKILSPNVNLSGNRFIPDVYTRVLRASL